MRKRRYLKPKAPSDEKKKSIVKMIEIRLEGIGEATRRAKIAFIIIVIASCAMLVTIFNTYFSFTRDRGFEDTFKFKALSIKNENEFIKRLEKQNKKIVKKVNEIYSTKTQCDAEHLGCNKLKSLADLKKEISEIDKKIYAHQSQIAPNQDREIPKEAPEFQKSLKELSFKEYIEQLEFQKKLAVKPYLEILNSLLEDKDFYQKIDTDECNEKDNKCELDDLFGNDIEKNRIKIKDIIKDKILNEKTADFYKSGSNHVNKLILEKTFPEIEWTTFFSENYWPFSLYEHNKRAISEGWIENQNIRISLLGIGVNVDQFSLLGSAALMIISFWLLFSLRRENRAIVTLLRDVKQEIKRPKDETEKYRRGEYKDDAWDIANLAYHGIVHKMVFAQTGSHDRPLVPQNIFGGESRWFEKIVNKVAAALTSVIRALVSILFFLPVITIIVILWVDDYTTTENLYPYTSNPAGMLIDRNVHYPEQIVGEIYNWGIGFLIATFASCIACAIFQIQTTRTLKDYERKLHSKKKKKIFSEILGFFRRILDVIFQTK